MKIFDIALKNLKQDFRSLFAIGMMFVAPLMITGLLYLAFGGIASGKSDLPVTKVVVVNLDTPPMGSPAIGQMTVAMYQDPTVSKWLQTNTAIDEPTARQMVDRQEAGVAVIIPVNFSQSLITGQSQPEVKIIQDPTLTIGPVVIKNMLGSLIDGVTGTRIALQTEADRRSALGLKDQPEAQTTFVQAYQTWYTDFQRTLYHSQEAVLIAKAPAATSDSNSAQSGGIQQILGLALVGQIIFFGFYTGAYSMMTILREDADGTLARLFSTPTSRSFILAGNFLSVILMVTVQALVLLVAGAVLFGVHWGQPASVFMVIIGQVVAATGLGVLLISLVKTTQQAGPVLGGGLTFLGMMGGLFTASVPSMPKIFDVLGQFTPQGWVMKAWKICLAGGAPVDVLSPLGVLIGMGVILFIAGAVIFRRRFV
jgi:ABC-2 type transport system permease protein